MKSANPLEILSCPLEGISLIEASAGTGKTWNICGLYLRLLLERELEVQRILVVTFTNAATAELRERVRQRIIDTLSYLKGDGAGAADPVIAGLVGRLRASSARSDEQMEKQLELALATFDEAAIFTIHGFCQRALSDTPFTAQMPLAMELLQDDSELLREAANDFWRRHVAADGLDAALAAFLVQSKDSPEKFAKLLKRRMAKPTAQALWPAGIDAPGQVDEARLAAAYVAARDIWQADRGKVIAVVMENLGELNAGSYKPGSVDKSAQGWDELLREVNVVAAMALEPEKIDLLCAERLAKSTKKGKTTPVHPFFAAAQALLDARQAAGQCLQLQRLALLRDLLEDGSQALREGKRKRHVIAFDDMLFNLHERLSSGQAPWLAASLRQRFPVALIDEFQDTDPLQFRIFDAIYSGSDNPLFLVGDPKQAIYSFRNADLHTYLQARKQARVEYTLLENQRSTQPLLQALNGLFGANPAAFMLPELDYHAVDLGAKPRSGLIDKTLARASLQVWTLPHDAETGEPTLHKKDARAAAAQATAVEVARLLSGAATGQITLDGRALRAGDMAVLVRSHAEGSLMRQAFAQLDVGSVELSQASVYDSSDAEDLDRLLSAMLEPARERLLKAALATEVMGLDAAGIEALGASESAMLALVQRFANYRDSWLQQGVGFMLRHWLVAEKVAERLLRRADGERRMTNLLHLTECLHQAAQSHATPDALLRWFQTQRRDALADDASQLRLESDQNLVQIVTVHKAKGLEFTIVFCPFLWNGHLGGGPAGMDGVEYHDAAGQAVVDFRANFEAEFDAEEIKSKVKLEASAEALRLIYVALTRAVHRCVVVAGCYLVKYGKTSSTSESRRSLLNWLVAGAGQTPQEWFEHKMPATDIAAAWDRLATKVGASLGIEVLPDVAGISLQADRIAPEFLAALPAPQHIPSGWWLGSYSGLAHGASHERAALDHDHRVLAVEATTVSAVPVRMEEDDILRFPRGAAAGDCLHAVFEHIDFTDPGGWPDAIRAALHKLQLTMPVATGTSQEEQSLLQNRRLQRMLTDVLATSLPVGTEHPLLLSTLPLDRRLSEMEFHLPSHRLDCHALNTTLATHGYDTPKLSFPALRGFLKGFIDLVFEHEGRYFILDWKSNHLGDGPAHYGSTSMAAEMKRQGYHLQYLLYCVALDRHLGRRIPQYEFAQHFGGVLYLFVRGLRPGWKSDDGAPTGLYFHRPTAATIEGLSRLLEEKEVVA